MIEITSAIFKQSGNLLCAMHALNKSFNTDDKIFLLNVINLVSSSIVLIALLLLSPSTSVSTSSEVVGCRNSKLFILTAGGDAGTEECTFGIVSHFLTDAYKEIALEIALGFCIGVL